MLGQLYLVNRTLTTVPIAVSAVVLYLFVLRRRLLLLVVIHWVFAAIRTGAVPAVLNGASSMTVVPFARQAGGEHDHAVYAGGQQVQATFLATAADTNGEFAVIESVQPRGGFAAPPHVHSREDESFYVLEGELTFQIGDRTIVAPAGTFVFGPRRVPHAFRVTSETDARTLTIIAPGGFEAFFTIPPDPGTIAEVAARFGLRLVGGPPGQPTN